MISGARITYDYDPCGNAQGYVENWEREFRASALRTEAIEGAKVRKEVNSHVEPMRLPFWRRVAYLTHLAHRARPALHPGA
jgi:hypothetical protein